MSSHHKTGLLGGVLLDFLLCELRQIDGKLIVEVSHSQRIFEIVSVDYELLLLEGLLGLRKNNHFCAVG